TVDPDTEVCSLLGSKEGLGNLFRGLISYRSTASQKEVILVPDPGYASYGDAIRICGGLPMPLKMTPDNRYMPDFEARIKELKAEGIGPERIKALVLCYPSNPTGMSCTLDYYEQAVAVCKRHNILLINDPAYADLYFPGEEPPHSALEVAGAKDITIEFHTLSKPYAATGWRIGFAVGHPDAITALERVKGTVDSGIFKAIQKAGAFALTSPECEAYILEQNALYQTSQQLMVDGLRELGWPMDDVMLPKATFYLWIPVPPRFESATDFATQLLEKSGIVIVPGTAFGQYGEGYVRLSLVDTHDNMREALRRMKEDGFTWQ
ncbi:MAG: aminotransferase class I/II-fold pyridoxal phosphate-dependent enzyme, partial [Cyanobacteria bacterium HKST-UBA04]|nr:aminotransferase class I/II-fold pyridoxal phosphate-dependent enzyme [Cyanobacteria bacterium HKST-UBA04]